MKTGKNILISPLDWGLGHAARIIPLAERLEAGGHKVILAGAERFRSFFSAELPGLPFIAFPGFSPRYSSRLPQYLVLLFQLPLLVYHSVREHRRLETLICKHDIDIVISDNRFGLWNRKIKSVYITHQLTIPFPPPFRFLEFLGRAVHRAVISRYSLCLIPDLPGKVNLTGRLAHGMKLPPNARYAGILSRFSAASVMEGSDSASLSISAGGNGSSESGISNRDSGISNRDSDLSNRDRILVMLSGPEPQRSLMAIRLIEFLRGSSLPVTILGGGTPSEAIPCSASIEYLDRPGSPRIRELILGSRYIICRAGYTTIMELAALGRTALLIPVPGQTEQEYLAAYLSGKGLFKSIRQARIVNADLLPGSTSADFPALLVAESEHLLASALEEISGE